MYCKSVQFVVYGTMLAICVIDALGQESTQVCPSNLNVPAGESIVIDCMSQTGYTYQWSSPDASKLIYLSDAAAASPQFDAPEHVTVPQDIVYYRQTFDDIGNRLGQVSVTISMYPVNNEYLRSAKDRIVESLLSEERPLISRPFSREGTPTAKQTPFLRCESQITVESGAIAEIPCIGMHPSGGTLQYTVEFDWAPYSESQTLEDGAFNYFIRVPAIDERAAVRFLSISSSFPGEDEVISQDVEIHITNKKANLSCEDIVAEENRQTAFQCFPDSHVQGARYQFISHPSIVERGIYDHLPTFMAPEVSSDTSMSVTVRMFSPKVDHVVEQDFMLMIQNRQNIVLDLGIECDPAIREIYEGSPDFDVSCTAVVDTPSKLSWTFQEVGDTPPGARSDENIIGESAKFTFQVPLNVDEHTLYQYTIIATDELEQERRSSLPQEIFITVLNKPTILVECQDQETSVGTGTLDGVCEVSNDQAVDLIYEWSITPDDQRIQVVDGSIQFEVPEDQDTDLQTYTYSVTASAENADAPESPTSLTITVKKSFGVLELVCVSPLIIYEGSGEQALDCSAIGIQPEFAQPLEWNWRLQEGAEDLLQDRSPDPPTFSAPETVPATTFYLYEVQVQAKGYETSQPQPVLIEVRKKPQLSLVCPQEVIFSVGMAPQPIPCEVTNDQDAELDYIWQWDPTILLLETSTGTPLFAVPSQQRSYSETYPYTVTVWADIADQVQASTSVTVVNSMAGLSDQVDVSTSGLDLGTVGPKGKISLDPATEQISGLIYGREGVYVGRMMVRAQDSVTVALEHLEPATLRQVDSNHQLTLSPQWAYSESCVMFAANTQPGQTVQVGMSPGDCHVIRVGGDVTMEDAQIGTYIGEVSVVLAVNGIDQLYTIPVKITVETERRMVVLGPGGVYVRPASETNSTLEWEESISIQPRVAVLGPNTPSGTFEINNPSLRSMEVTVATEFGYRETRETERFSVLVTEQNSEQGSLANLISVHPTTVVLMPGETKQIHYAIPAQTQLPDRGHAVLFNFTATPREYIAQIPGPLAEQVPRITFQAPGVYIPGQGPEQLTASIQSSTDESVVVLVETNTYPFYGQIIVKNESGQETGRSDILVYTRSRVRIDLTQAIDGGITLEFVPYAPNQNIPPDVYVPADS